MDAQYEKSDLGESVSGIKWTREKGFPKLRLGTEGNSVNGKEFVLSGEEAKKLREHVISSSENSGEEVLEKFEKTVQSIKLEEILNELESRDVSSKHSRFEWTQQSFTSKTSSNSQNQLQNERVLDLLDEENEKLWLKKLHEHKTELQSRKNEMIESITKVSQKTNDRGNWASNAKRIWRICTIKTGGMRF